MRGGGNPTLGTAEIDALTAIGFTAVPEPATCVFAAAAVVLVVVRRRRWA